MKAGSNIGKDISKHSTGMNVPISLKMQGIMHTVQKQMAIHSAMKEAKKGPMH